MDCSSSRGKFNPDNPDKHDKATCCCHLLLADEATGSNLMCRYGVNDGLMLGPSGLLPVQAIDSSCGTLELPPNPDGMAAPVALPYTPPNNHELFWAQAPLRHLVRSCAGGSPYTGAPWRRLVGHMPADPSPDVKHDSVVDQSSAGEQQTKLEAHAVVTTAVFKAAPA
jgi:hypothetical protein